MLRNLVPDFNSNSDNIFLSYTVTRIDMTLHDRSEDGYRLSVQHDVLRSTPCRPRLRRTLFGLPLENTAFPSEESIVEHSDLVYWLWARPLPRIQHVHARFQGMALLIKTAGFPSSPAPHHEAARTPPLSPRSRHSCLSNVADNSITELLEARHVACGVLNLQP